MRTVEYAGRPGNSTLTCAAARLYDVVFTAEMRCLIDGSGVVRADLPRPKYPAVDLAAGLSIGGGAIWVERRGSRLRIARLRVPPPSLPPSTHRKPRLVWLPDGRGTAQFSGTLVRDDVDSYVVSSKEQQLLRVRIDGFPGRGAVLRVRNLKDDELVDVRLATGVRQWTGPIPVGATYSVEVARLAPYCDPPLIYDLQVTLQ